MEKSILTIYRLTILRQSVKGNSPFKKKTKKLINIDKPENKIENIVDNSDKEIKHKENLNLNLQLKGYMNTYLMSLFI